MKLKTQILPLNVIYWAFKSIDRSIDRSIKQSINQSTLIFTALNHIQRCLKALCTISRKPTEPPQRKQGVNQDQLTFLSILSCIIFKTIYYFKFETPFFSVQRSEPRVGWHTTDGVLRKKKQKNNCTFSAHC